MSCNVDGSFSNAGRYKELACSLSFKLSFEVEIIRRCSVGDISGASGSRFIIAPSVESLPSLKVRHCSSKYYHLPGF